MKIDNNLNLRQLNIEEMKYVYDTYMIKHFPDDELKPFILIENAYNKGIYDALGIIMNDEIIGYAYFVISDNNYLFDYFGIKEECRNLGIGSKVLDLIREYYYKANSIIGEVEDFNLATNNEDKSIQKRRYDFYLRNGCIDTGVKVILFDVDYIVIILSSKKDMDQTCIKKLYLEVYKSILPKKLFDEKVKIK